MAKSPSIRTHRTSIAALCAAAGASLAAPERALAYNFDATEAAFDAAYAATPISLTLRVVDEQGAPVSEAHVTAIGWGSAAGTSGLGGASDASGDHTFPSLGRRSLLIRIQHPSFFIEIVPVDLQRPLTEAAVDLGAVVLTQRKEGRARLLFGGDTMFGRRFIDADGDGVEGEPGDLIQPDTRAEDATALLRFMVHSLASADYTQVNLESVVTADPATPHPYKNFTFFSYPETLSALEGSGIDAVSLGNNHVYDYLEAGLADTIAAVPSAGLDWFGAGTSETTAKGTVVYRTIGQGVQIALQGFNQLVNDGTTLPEYALVARDAPAEKAGSLEMSSTNVSGFVADERPDRLTIPVLHGGFEYSDYPSSGMRLRFTQLIQQGADLIVAHHPHVVHGVGLVTAGGVPHYVLMSLGNLIFDQDVFETFQSYLAVVDVDESGIGSHDVHRVQLVPFHIEGYSPKLVSHEWFARAARQVGHLSTMLPAAPNPGDLPDGLVGATVFPAGSQVAVARSPSQYLVSEMVEALPLPVTALSTGVIEYPRADPADMLARIQTSAPMACRLGRDLAIYGDFEDQDVDNLIDEASMWTAGMGRYVENSVVHRGNAAYVLLRSSSNSGVVTASMSNRIKFDPARSLTLRGFLKGSNAATFRALVTWYTSGGGTLSSSYVYTRAGGTYDWQAFNVDLAPPANAAVLRLTFTADVPASGEAATFLDDIALITWEASVADASAGFPLATPNAWAFLRCTTSNPALSSVGLQLTHRSYDLAAGPL